MCVSANLILLPTLSPTCALLYSFLPLCTYAHELCKQIWCTIVNVKKSWRAIGPKTACDTSAGEVYLQDSPGTVSTLEQCKTMCEHATECQSITYYESGWCSHYSTPCTRTMLTRKAVALQLIADSEKGETFTSACVNRSNCNASFFVI